MEIVFNRPVSAGGCEIDEVYTISSKKSFQHEKDFTTYFKQTYFSC